MRFAQLPHAALPAAVLSALAAGALLTGCTSADLPQASTDAVTSGGTWATQADAACQDIASTQTRPADAGSGTEVLAWHQNVAYTLVSRLQALPDADDQAKQLVDALNEVGTNSEALVTALQATPVDEAAREKADAARTAAIGKAASLSAQLGLTACTPLVAGAAS